jgi:hypothetical protein
MITTLTKGLKGLLPVGLGAFKLALAPHAVADTNDNAYVNAMPYRASAMQQTHTHGPRRAPRAA